jgi:hypothetical protein
MPTHTLSIQTDGSDASLMPIEQGLRSDNRARHAAMSPERNVERNRSRHRRMGPKQTA